MIAFQRLGGLIAALAAACAQAADEPAPKTEPAPATRFEAALGVAFDYRPEYQGATRYKLEPTPAFYVRYGRVSFSQASGFVTRRQDDLPRGLGIELVSDERWHATLGLRLDRGRESSVSAALAGIEDVRTTVRMRAAATRQLGPHWKASIAWSTDVLGRGGGSTADLGIAYELRLGPRLIGALGTGLGWADARYMRSYYGVSAAASAASGYPAYTPSGGIKDIGVSSTLRMEIDPQWSAFVGAAAGRLLGPARASPLTATAHQWTVSGGIARRF